MSNPNFNPTYSSNLIWRDEDDTRCLTGDLDNIEADIAALETGKADTNHAHTGYAAATDVTALQNLVGDTAVSTQISTAIAGKVDAVEGKGLSTNDYTTAEKTKLAGIPEGGANVTVDTALSATSENPVQNKVVKSALDGKASSTHTHDLAAYNADGFMSAADKKKMEYSFFENLNLDAAYAIRNVSSNIADLTSYADGYYIINSPSNITIKIGDGTYSVGRKKFICCITESVSSFVILGKTTYSHSFSVKDLVTGDIYMALCTTNSSTPTYTSISKTEGAGIPLWGMIFGYIDAVMNA